MRKSLSMRAVTHRPPFAIFLIGLLCISIPGIVFADTSGSRVFTNLQFLPADTSNQQMLAIMKQMTSALGVECRTCHRTDIRDFASDEIQAKRKAREMMEMTARLNRNLSVGSNNKSKPFSCLSCHQGKLKPAAGPDNDS